MNILESLVNEAKKKKDELQQQLAAAAANPRQTISKAVDQINPLDNGRTWQQRTPVTNESAFQQRDQQLHNLALGTGLRGVRSLTGLAQGVSGLYDLATPGSGTSRVSKQLDAFAKQTDQTARDEGVNTGYQASALPVELLGFKGGGMLAKQGVRLGAEAAGTVLPRTTAVIQHNPVTDAIARRLAGLEAGNAGQRIAATALRTAAPANVINTAANTGLDLGAQASKGHDIDRNAVLQSVGANVFMNSGVPILARSGAEGLRATQPAIREAVNTAGEAALKTGQTAKDSVIAAANVKPYRSIPDAEVEAARRVRAAQGSADSAMDIAPQDLALYNRLHQRLGNDPSAVDKVINDRRVWADEGRGRVIRSDRAIQEANAADLPADAPDFVSRAGAKLKQFSADHPVGLGIKAVGPEPAVPTIRAYGKQIALTPENGYEAVPTAHADEAGNPVSIYRKIQRTSTNGKGHNDRVAVWYGADGTKLTDAQAQAALAGDPAMVGTKPLAPSPAAATPVIEKTARPTTPVENPVPAAAEPPGRLVETVGPPKQPTPFANREYVAPPESDKRLTQTDFPDESKLNTARLNLDNKQRAHLDEETIQVIDRLSNKEVEQMARSAGMDTRSRTIESTKKDVAEQLNVRRDAVRLSNEAEVARLAGDKGKAAQLLEEAAARGRISRSQGTDIARQLQARKIIANELDTPQHRVFRLLDEAGVDPKTYSRRLADVDFTNPREVVRAYRELVPAKAGSWLDLLRYNSMLSSPLTQAVNIFSNAQNVALVAPIEKNLRGVIDAIGGLFGRQRKYATGEGTAYLKGAVKAVDDASRNLVDAFKGTGKYADHSLDEYQMPLATSGVKGAAYKALNLPMRTLDSFDKFFRTLAEAGEDAALTRREQAGIAVRGNREAHKTAEADYRLFQTDIGTPGQGVVNDVFDTFAKGIMHYRNSPNKIVSTIAKFTVPFVKTVNNISKQGIVDYSPLGFANMKGSVDKETALTRAIMGTSVFGTAAALVASGQMTWAEPKNADQRNQFRAEGKQPYALKVGNSWVNFSKLAPAVAFPLAMTAAIDDAIKNKQINQGTGDAVLEAIAKYGSFLADQSYAKSIGQTLGALGGNKEDAAQMVGNNVQQLVPYRALTGWLARMSDSTERKVDTSQGWVDQQVQLLMQQYPVLRERTNSRDNAGVPIAANNPVLNAFSPVKVTDDRLAGSGTEPVAATAGGSGSAGGSSSKNSKNQIEAAFNSPEGRKFIQMTPEQRKEAAKTDPNVKALQTQYDAMKRSQNTPDLPAGLQDDNAKTLTRFAKLTDKGRQRVLERETDAEFKLKQAEYERDKLNGNLSETEDIRRQDDLLKAEVGSQYKQQVRDLYGLSKQQLYNLLSSRGNGKELAAQLVAYGDALEAAGVGDNKLRDAKGNVAIKPKEKTAGGGSGRSLSSQLAAFKLPYDSLISSSTAGAKLARSAGLAKKGRA